MIGRTRHLTSSILCSYQPRVRSIPENICCDVMPYGTNEVRSVRHDVTTNIFCMDQTQGQKELYCIPTQVKLQKVSVFLCYYGLKFSRSIRQTVCRRMDRLSANQILAFHPYFVWYTLRSRIDWLTGQKIRIVGLSVAELEMHKTFHLKTLITIILPLEK